MFQPVLHKCKCEVLGKNAKTQGSRQYTELKALICQLRLKSHKDLSLEDLNPHQMD